MPSLKRRVQDVLPDLRRLFRLHLPSVVGDPCERHARPPEVAGRIALILRLVRRVLWRHVLLVPALLLEVDGRCDLGQLHHVAQEAARRALGRDLRIERAGLRPHVARLDLREILPEGIQQIRRSRLRRRGRSRRPPLPARPWPRPPASGSRAPWSGSSPPVPEALRARSSMGDAAASAAVRNTSRRLQRNFAGSIIGSPFIAMGWNPHAGRVRRMTESATRRPVSRPSSFISNSGAWCGCGRPSVGWMPTRK